MTNCYPPLSRITSIHSTTSNHIFQGTLILSSHLQLRLPSCLFPYGFPTKNHYAFPFHPTHPTFPGNPILLHIIIRITGQYKSRSITIYNSSCTQRNSNYRYWSLSLWMTGGILSYCLLRKVHLLYLLRS